MTLDDLIEHLNAGLHQTITDVWTFSEDPDATVRPEYLNTMAIAHALHAAVAGHAIVRLEQSAGATLGASLLPGHRPAGFTSLVSRPGELDIVLSVEENGWKYPLVVVENKRYAAGYSTVEDDVIRCAELVSAQGTEGSLEVGVVTYLRREASGLTLAHLDEMGSRSIGRISKKAADVASTFGINHQHSSIKLRESAFANEEEALAEDQDGMPAYLNRPPFKVWGAMEIFWRTPRIARLAKL